MIVYPRSEWTNVLPRGSAGPDESDALPNFNPSLLLGKVVHYSGTPASYPLIKRETRALLESVRVYNMVTKGYSDIAYNLAVSGREAGVWELRGLTNRGAANGNSTTNGQYPSILCILAIDERPNDLMLANLKDAVKLVEARYPQTRASTKGHRDMRDTSCPGQITYDIIKNPAFWETPNVTPPNPPTWTCPLPVGNLSPGDSGVLVFGLISQLSFWGYYTARNDGVYGTYVSRAVAALQEDLKEQGRYDYSIDGQYGRYTRAGWCGLLEALSKMAG